MSNGLDVHVGDSAAPVFTSPSTVNFTVGAAGSFAFTATGNPAPVITQAGTLPPGVTFNNGVLAGTPTAAGAYTFAVMAANSAGNSLQSFTLVVAASPSPTPAPTPKVPVDPTVVTNDLTYIKNVLDSIAVFVPPIQPFVKVLDAVLVNQFFIQFICLAINMFNNGFSKEEVSQACTNLLLHKMEHEWKVN